MMNYFHNDIEECKRVLSTGGLILYPTDTIWGIGCDARNESAVKRVFELKKRPDTKQMIILLADVHELGLYVEHAREDLMKIVEGASEPLTVIYEGAKNLAPVLVNNGTIAIRVTNDPFCKSLIESTGIPLVSTSANISGYPQAANFTEISPEIKNGVDYIVKHRQDDLEERKPSSIITVDSDGSIKYLRKS